MAEGELDDITNSLGKEVGGIPVWVIGGGVGIALAGAIWFWHRQQGAGIAVNTFVPDTTGATDPNADPTNSDFGLPNGPAGDWLAENPGSTAFPVGGSALPSPITNGQWARQAIDGLIAKGDDPTLVNNAITKYVSGQGLTAAEKAIVSIALTLFGSLPEGAKGIIDAGTTPPATGGGSSSKPRGYGWRQVRAGDTASSIAKSAGISLAAFYAMNGPGRLVAGQWVKIRGGSNPVIGPFNGK